MADIEIKRVPRVDIAKSGSLVGTRPRINLIEGSNITLTVTDDSANNEVDVTIAASGGSPAGSDTQIQFNDAGAFGASASFRWDEANTAIVFGANTTPNGKIFGFTGTAGQPNGGNVVIASGAPYDDGMGTPQNAGDISIGGNDGVNGGNGGSATVYGGAVTNGQPGSVTIAGGDVFSEGPGASINIVATNAAANTNPDQNGGNVNITIGIETGSGTPGALTVTNASSAAGTGNVTVGNVAPGTTAISVTAWMRITVDGTPYLLPLFS